MKILLLGEYSNVHHTLAQGLKALGHEVTVASDGDNWKNYPRDIDMRRKSLSPVHTLLFLFRTWRQFRTFKGYDIVQLINPVFLPLKAERIWPYYNRLRKNNRRIVMGAFGMDYYYVKGCLDFSTFEYSDFNIGNMERYSNENDEFKRDWLNGSKGELNKRVAKDADAIVAGLYEYFACYKKYYSPNSKVTFIPFPIKPLNDIISHNKRKTGDPLRIFIGIQRKRSAYKGTDIMLKAAKRISQEYPDECELKIAESIPFEEYIKMMRDSDVILDQLYSYTPAMNALEAMNRGLITIGGGEAENYTIIHEMDLRPIVNVKPNETSVYESLKYLVENRDELVAKLKNESIEYILKHHDYIKVAKAYEKLYQQILNQSKI